MFLGGMFISFIFGCASSKQFAGQIGILPGKIQEINDPLLKSPITSMLFSTDNAGSNILYAATEDSGVVRSTDMGIHWNKFSSGFGSAYVSQLAQNSRGDIFAATIGGGIFELPVKTEGWKRVDMSVGGDELTRVTALVISPRNNSIYVATLEHGVYKSSDNGATWVSFSEGLGILNINTLAITDYDMLYLRCVGDGVSRRAKSWIEWKPLNDSIDDPYTTIIGFQHNGPVFCGTRNGAAFRMSKDDTHWENISTGLPKDIINCFGSSESGAMLAGTKQGIYKFNADSLRWDCLSDATQSMNIRSICVLLDGTTFAGTESDGILKFTLPLQ